MTDTFPTFLLLTSPGLLQFDGNDDDSAAKEPNVLPAGAVRTCADRLWPSGPIAPAARCRHGQRPGRAACAVRVACGGPGETGYLESSRRMACPVPPGASAGAAAREYPAHRPDSESWRR